MDDSRKQFSIFYGQASIMGVELMSQVNQAINQGDDKGIKILCTLMFKGQSKFVDILSQELKKHMQTNLKLS